LVERGTEGEGGEGGGKIVDGLVEIVPKGKRGEERREKVYTEVEIYSESKRGERSGDAKRRVDDPIYQHRNRTIASEFICRVPEMKLLLNNRCHDIKKSGANTCQRESNFFAKKVFGIK
jgi:hypothetical protein